MALGDGEGDPGGGLHGGHRQELQDGNEEEIRVGDAAELVKQVAPDERQERGSTPGPGGKGDRRATPAAGQPCPVCHKPGHW